MRARSSGCVRGVYVGTSSWKYEGWINRYTPERYAYRGQLARSRFDRSCLGEYAQVFKTVCVDAAYYAFPGRTILQRMADQAPENFLFGFKVTDTITVKKFPNLARFGDRAGKVNDQFLDADLFAKAFLEPCEAIQSEGRALIFEFSGFWPTDHSQRISADLTCFWAARGGWPFGRNATATGRTGLFRVSGAGGVACSTPGGHAAGRGNLPPESRTSRAVAPVPSPEGGTRRRVVSAIRQDQEVKRGSPSGGAALIFAATPGRKTFITSINRLEGNA